MVRFRNRHHLSGCYPWMLLVRWRHTRHVTISRVPRGGSQTKCVSGVVCIVRIAFRTFFANILWGRHCCRRLHWRPWRRRRPWMRPFLRCRCYRRLHWRLHWRPWRRRRPWMWPLLCRRPLLLCRRCCRSLLRWLQWRPQSSGHHMNCKKHKQKKQIWEKISQP